VPPSRIGKILYLGWRVKPDYLFRGTKTSGSLSADKQTITMVEQGSSNQSRSATPFRAFSGYGVQASATHATGCVSAEKDNRWRNFVRLHPW